MTHRVPRSSAAPRIPRLLARAVASAILCVVLASTAASAHTDLVASTPRAGDTVALSTQRLVLVFGSDLVGSAQLSVRDDAGTDRVAGGESVAGDTVEVAVELRRPGRHEVTYRVLAGDGHVVVGEFSFDAVERDVGPPTATTQDEDVLPAGVGATGDETLGVPVPLPGPTDTEDGLPSPLWWMGSLAAVGTVVLLVRRMLTRTRE